MSRIGLLLGLILSLVLHAALLGFTGQEPVSTATLAPPTVEVVALPAPEPQPTKAPLKPTPQPTTRPDPKPQAKPKPAATPAAPRLTEVAKQTRSSVKQRGDFAGSSQGEHQPRLRIDWGNPAQARQTLSAGGMKLVVFQPGEGFKREVVYAGGAWRSQNPQLSASNRYTNRLRIVDGVPAFAAAKRAAQLRGGERLAVLLPEALEHELRTQQLAAASKRGLTESQIAAYGGRFVPAGSGLRLQITHVQPRSTTP